MVESESDLIENNRGGAEDEVLRGRVRDKLKQS